MILRLSLLALLSVLLLGCLPFEDGQPAKGYTWGQPPLRLCVSSVFPADSEVEAVAQSVDTAANTFDAVPGIDLDCADPHATVTFYFTTDSLTPEIEEYHSQLPPLGIFDVNGRGCPGLWATAGQGPLFGRLPEVSPACNGTIAEAVVYWPSMGPADSNFEACAIWRSMGVLLPCSEPFDTVVDWLRIRYGLPEAP